MSWDSIRQTFANATPAGKIVLLTGTAMVVYALKDVIIAMAGAAYTLVELVALLVRLSYDVLSDN